MPRKDYTGQRFGKLTVIKMIWRYKKPTKCICKCDCGTVKEYSMNYLSRGNTTHCGCLKKRQTIKNNKCKKCGKDKGANRWWCDSCLSKMNDGINEPYKIYYRGL